MDVYLIHPEHINIIKETAKLRKVTIGLLTDKAIAGCNKFFHLSCRLLKSVVANIKGIDRIVPQTILDLQIQSKGD